MTSRCFISWIYDSKFKKQQRFLNFIKLIPILDRIPCDPFASNIIGELTDEIFLHFNGQYQQKV